MVDLASLAPTLSGAVTYLPTAADGSPALGTTTANGTYAPISTTLTQAAAAGTYSPFAQAANKANLYAYGDSYTAVAGASASQYAFVERVTDRLQASLFRRGVAGTTMGSIVNVLVNGNAGNNFPAWVDGTTGLCLLKAVVNSVINTTSANDAQEKIAFPRALRTVLRIMRSASWVVHTDASIAYTGTWSTPAIGNTRNGTIHKTSTVGDKLTITTTASEISLMLLTWPGAGVTFAITVNGTPYTSDFSTTGNQASPAESWHDSAARITGLSGTSTIVVTNTGGADFYFDGYLIPSATPNPVVVGKEAIPTVAGLTVNGVDTNRTAANLAVFNNFVDSVCAEPEFAAGGLVKVANPVAGYDNTIMENTGVRPHPNNLGHAFYADAFLRAISTFGYVPGFGSASSWIPITLQNGWVNFGSGYNPVGFRREGGRVYLRGLIASGTTTADIKLTNLPAGYRPAYECLIPCAVANAGATPAFVKITTGGDVLATGFNSGYSSLDGVSFAAEIN